MTGNEYQISASRTNDGLATKRLDFWIEENRYMAGDILNACLGLSGEVGEFNDMVKKCIFHEKDFDLIHAKKELGDIMWYISQMCEAFDWDLDEIMQINIEKLKARYPDGFDVNKANNRQAGDI